MLNRHLNNSSGVDLLVSCTFVSGWMMTLGSPSLKIDDVLRNEVAATLNNKLPELFDVLCDIFTNFWIILIR